MNKRRKTERTIQELFIMTVATLIIAAAVFFFLIPSHAAVSSVSGLAMVLYYRILCLYPCQSLR